MDWNKIKHKELRCEFKDQRNKRKYVFVVEIEICKYVQHICTGYLLRDRENVTTVRNLWRNGDWIELIDTFRRKPYIRHSLHTHSKSILK